MTDVNVLVPSYRRPDDLRRCLKALCDQHLAPVQVVVVARDVDEPTHWVAKAFADRLPLTIVTVTQPGQVHALNAGLDATDGDVVAITDDDAAPRPDWLARIAAHFAADPDLGGLGGRDWVHQPDGLLEDGSRRRVGKVQWFGRIVGNHHLGAGVPRAVDMLKGANMSYRRRAIAELRFDARLRGQGAQIHNDMAFSMAVRRLGWKLVYDPAVAVDHYPAPRADIDQRGVFHPEAIGNAAFNQMWATQTQLTGWKRWSTRQWQEWVGTRGEPGYAHLLCDLPRSSEHAWARFAAARRGRRQAARSLESERP
ncbi:MAG: glycosyltransferase [Betaproteobacteria bacterium]|nr:glycosyltransferase [Betaproteobacteria bacterium]